MLADESDWAAYIANVGSRSRQDWRRMTCSLTTVKAIVVYSGQESPQHCLFHVFRSDEPPVMEVGVSQLPLIRNPRAGRLPQISI